MKTYTQVKEKLLKDKEIKRAYDVLGPEFEIISLFIKRRLERGFTQKDLARRIRSKQSSVSRFESGKYNPTVSFLYKIVKGLNAEMKITVSTKK